MSVSLIPDMIFPSLPQITPQELQTRGITTLLMDFDNTIVPYTTSTPTGTMQSWLRQMQQSGIRLCVVSNSRKPRVERFCQQYGLACITHAKKPFQRGLNEAKRRFSLDADKTALVGDQIYTDVLGANCAGMQSILVSAINNHTIWLKLRHVAELPFIACGKRRIKHEKSGKVSVSARNRRG